jgi:hypothetical protein
MVARPTCSGRATARTVPARTARRKLVFDSSVEVDAPLRPRLPGTAIDAPEMAAVRQTLQQLLAGHEPFPAVIVDRGWNLVLANASTAVFTEGLSGQLIAPPLNVLRASLHPEGLAPRILNFAEWSGHLLSRLRREVIVTGDTELAALYDELSAYPGVSTSEPAPAPGQPHRVVVPLRIWAGTDELAFLSIVATFGTAVDITVAELSIESFFPADAATAAALRSR